MLFFRIGLAVLLMLAALPASSAQLTIPGSHPRIWYGNAQRLQVARSYFARNPFARVTYDPYDPAGTNYRRALRAVLAQDAVSCQHALHGDPASAPPPRPELPIDSGLMGHPLSPPSQPGGFRDEIRQQGDAWIIVYDWCRDFLTPAEASAMQQRWNGYMQRELDDTFGQEGEEAGNYWSGRTRNLLLWGIATHGENSRAQEFIDIALDERMDVDFNRWYADFGRGGVFPEGSDYGVVGLSYPLMAFTSAADFGFDPFDVYPYFREGLYALIYGSTPGRSSIVGRVSNQFGLFTFGDDEHFYSGGAINEREYLGDFTRILGARDQTGNARHARAWMTASSAGAGYVTRAMEVPAGNPADLAQLPLDYYAPGADVFAARTSHDANAMQVHLQLGTPGGMSHRHMDAGSFQVWRKGQWLTRETAGYNDRIVALGFPTGSSTTVDTLEAVAHNTLLFEGQTTGRWIGDGPQRFPPGTPPSDQPRSLPQVKRVHHANDFAYVAVDYSQANRNGLDTRVDWPYTDRAWREFLFLRDLQALVVLDRTRGSSDSLRPFYGTNNWIYRQTGRRIAADQVQRTFVMHFETQPVARSPQRIEAVVGTQTSELITLLPATPTVRMLNEDPPCPNPPMPCADRLGQFRVEIPQSGTADAYFLNVITGYDANEARMDARVDETATQWVVTLTHPTRGSAVVTFEKGVDSQGGSVRIGALGPSQPLRRDVQGIRVTDDGPVWDEAENPDRLFRNGFE